MFESPNHLESIFSALQHLKYKKHDVVLFHVIDKQHEVDFEFENRPYQFIDMETNEEIKINPTQISDFYKNKIADYIDSIKLKCAQYKIDFVEADIHEGFNPVLLQYMLKRQKMY